MAINTMLEATKARQAKEIRDLRRKLRETRLILPPRAFAAIRSSEAHVSSTDVVTAYPSSNTIPDNDQESSEDDKEDEEERQREGEYRLDRICAMVNAMYDHASEAVKRVAEPREADESASRTKVLSPDELELYHGATGSRSNADDRHNSHDDMSEAEETVVDLPPRPMSPSRLPRPISPPKLTITSGSPVKLTAPAIPSPLRRIF